MENTTIYLDSDLNESDITTILRKYLNNTINLESQYNINYLNQNYITQYRVENCKEKNMVIGILFKTDQWHFVDFFLYLLKRLTEISKYMVDRNRLFSIALFYINRDIYLNDFLSIIVETISNLSHNIYNEIKKEFVKYKIYSLKKVEKIADFHYYNMYLSFEHYIDCLEREDLNNFKQKTIEILRSLNIL
ncbi:hypothetical protein [Paramaledivibacter caminithermalis]|jgi:hypothetical protein|nr:hypothetical protein [Paramaledivibacter caminithermalis]